MAAAGTMYVLAVPVKLAFLLEVSRSPVCQCPTINEHFHYITAEAIASGTACAKGFFHAPGHLYFLAGICKMFGGDSIRTGLRCKCLAGLAATDWWSSLRPDGGCSVGQAGNFGCRKRSCLVIS